MSVIFKDPNNSVISDWLKVNIEDEFKRPLLNWGLEFNLIQTNSSSVAYLRFEPKVTPHVSGGNVIVMDQNTPIEEYEVQWTIRHEYGHILGLPDCYQEFYEPEKKLITQYQLDITDLMCSRAGDMNDRIYKELKRNYYTKQ